jgi:hypothetical protein
MPHLTSPVLSIFDLHADGCKVSDKADLTASIKGLALIHPTYFPSRGRPLSGLQRTPAENRLNRFLDDFFCAAAPTSGDWT